jgi:ATP-dependent Clp protease adapter protein ClpS
MLTVARRATLPRPVAAPPRTQHRSPPLYKLLLHRDEEHSEGNYTAKVVARVIDGMTMEEATQKWREANATGLSILRTCQQDLAEDYCTRIRRNGVRSTIEPA